MRHGGALAARGALLFQRGGRERAAPAARMRRERAMSLSLKLSLLVNAVLVSWAVLFLASAFG
jgi:hypothetical protein